MKQTYALESLGYHSCYSHRERTAMDRTHNKHWRRTVAVIMVTLMWGMALISAFHQNWGVVSAQTKGVPYTVHTGDTLWDIATTTEATGADTRAVVLQIMQLNHMQNAHIYAGEHLLLPGGR